MKKTICFLSVLLAFFAMANLSVVRAQDLHDKNGIVCQSCQTLNPPGSKFCGECGKPLQVAPVAIFDTVLPDLEVPNDRQAISAPDSVAAKAMFDLAGHLLAQGQYGLAASYYRRIVEAFPVSYYTKASLLMEKECWRLQGQAGIRGDGKKPKKKGNGSAFGGAFLGALVAPLAILAILSAAY